MVSVSVGSTKVMMRLLIDLQVKIKDFLPSSLSVLKPIVGVCMCLQSVSVTACTNTRVYLALMQSDKEVSLGNHSPLFLFRYDKHCVLEW